MNYQTPSEFDWGMFKPNGISIFWLSLFLYIYALRSMYLSFDSILNRIFTSKIMRKTILYLVMSVPFLFAIISITSQMSSMHYQERIHFPTVIVLSATYILAQICRYITLHIDKKKQHIKEIAN